MYLLLLYNKRVKTYHQIITLTRGDIRTYIKTYEGC